MPFLCVFVYEVIEEDYDDRDFFKMIYSSETIKLYNVFGFSSNKYIKCIVLLIKKCYLYECKYQKKREKRRVNGNAVHNLIHFMSFQMNQYGDGTCI